MKIARLLCLFVSTVIDLNLWSLILSIFVFLRVPCIFSINSLLYLSTLLMNSSYFYTFPFVLKLFCYLCTVFRFTYILLWFPIQNILLYYFPLLSFSFKFLYHSLSFLQLLLKFNLTFFEYLYRAIIFSHILLLGMGPVSILNHQFFLDF